MSSDASARTVAVFCSSSAAVAEGYNLAAEALGAEVARRGHTLVYGGASVGTMGIVARAVHAGGGRVVGVIPDFMVEREIAYLESDELLITQTLRERKAAIEARADAFVSLPGGFGTLEEVIEIFTLKQLGVHNKAVVFLNIDGFYDPLFVFFDHLFAQRFAKPETRDLYHVAHSATEALDYIEAYEPPSAPSKWFDPVRA